MIGKCSEEGNEGKNDDDNYYDHALVWLAGVGMLVLCFVAHRCSCFACLGWPFGYFPLSIALESAAVEVSLIGFSAIVEDLAFDVSFEGCGVGEAPESCLAC